MVILRGGEGEVQHSGAVEEELPRLEEAVVMRMLRLLFGRERRRLGLLVLRSIADTMRHSYFC